MNLPQQKYLTKSSFIADLGCLRKLWQHLWDRYSAVPFGGMSQLIMERDTRFGSLAHQLYLGDTLIDVDLRNLYHYSKPVSVRDQYYFTMKKNFVACLDGAIFCRVLPRGLFNSYITHTWSLPFLYSLQAKSTGFDFNFAFPINSFSR